MTIPDVTMTELIEDCAQLPPAITHPEHPLPSPRAAATWQVDDFSARQAEGLDEYV